MLVRQRRRVGVRKAVVGRDGEGCHSPPSATARPADSAFLLARFNSISHDYTAFLLLLCLAYLLHYKRTYGSFIFWRKRSYISPRVKAFLERYGSLHLKVYSYAEVKQMTNLWRIS
ncbi:unnamed protein product [Urochloa humidicola]